jgi:hypothetical protein
MVRRHESALDLGGFVSFALDDGAHGVSQAQVELCQDFALKCF